MVPCTSSTTGVTIDALLAEQTLKIHVILGLARNPESNADKKLSDRGVALVKGDLEDATSVFRSAKQALGGAQSVWEVFAVQTAFGLGALDVSERRQGMALVEAAE
ncbi:uncharacterized protein TRIVIDRAFT_228284 [Trichoderma virens Gv29-8]|uniref:NmrA-like domain-containing protein n=1 Tax=Hypocrea virens (strain Gv29-8 / FGSC 10586) TaxID=413071 RepID=G9NC19_HYPVG|nr:uncharacterized protein TRIVIDRAFT_228284 [Trichoderma virens Gv29-8]EHK15244.1 hypothetical protein TRIVIDRAFT_228284 [Trichoderma virens Gv29-8]UKZ51188.1 hypothetical protein TrVGV298_004944 [Trichoderma virens]